MTIEIERCINISNDMYASCNTYFTLTKHAFFWDKFLNTSLKKVEMHLSLNSSNVTQ